MTSGAPWSVKGIDPKAREVAKDLARRSGMNLGEWLNRMILEDDGPEDLTDQEQFTQTKDYARYDPRPSGDERHRDPGAQSPPARLSPDRVAEQIVRAAREPSSLPAQGGYLETPRASGSVPPRVEAPLHPGDNFARVVETVDRLAERIAVAEERTSAAIGGVAQSVRDALARIEIGEREHVAVAARFEGAAEELAAQQEKLAERLRKYETDGSGPRSAEALHALEQALGKVAGHVYQGEARAREILDAVEARVQRLEAAEADDPAAFADEVLGRLGAGLAEAQAKTTEALDGLRSSFADLDGRLRTAEQGEQTVELRLADLTASLTSRVEASRAEIAEQLNASANERFDRMERRLDEVGRQVSAGEQRSAEAIEQMSRDVLSVSETLNRNLHVSEQRGADAIEQVGGEVARIAAAMEAQLGRVDTVQAEALERLSGEIERITERLGERIAAAERRSAHAVDDVGEKIARVTDKFNARHDRASEDLAERLRLSEERTARLVEEARGAIDQRLIETQRQHDAPAAPVQHADLDPFGGAGPSELGPAEPDRPAEPTVDLAPLAAFPETGIAEQASEPAFDEVDFDAADGFEPPLAEPGFELSPPPVPAIPAAAAPEPATAIDDDIGFSGETDFLRSDATPGAMAAETDEADVSDPLDLGFPDEPPVEADARGDELPEPAQEDEDLFEPAAAAEPAAPLTTREIIEQARAAARASSTGGDKQRADKARAEAGPKPLTNSLFSGFGLSRPKRKKRSTGALQTALLVAGGAAFLSVGAAGLVVMGAKPGGKPPERVASSLEAAAPIAAVEGSDSAFAPPPRASVAVTTQGLGLGASPSVAATRATDLDADFDAATLALGAQTPGGLDALKKTANLGHAPAQLFLASLYESGGQGLKKDLAEARRWTERAARGGDRKAMHNLALYAFEGVGGEAKSPQLAAQWFRKAADLGLIDSQYNLGRLYEQGLGVNRNPAEAYKWYLIAARSGDEESRSSAQRVRARLTADARAVAERAAVGFRATAPEAATAASGVTPSASVVIAQQALSRLGYYQGPRDGVASPALRMAVTAYQSEQGLPTTGALDETTVSRLSVFTR